ncbi:hypothetical protein FGF66_11195 [Chlorobaculum thiosulfatiphilum]|uniref:Uncharacterized protein n=1 Tax=Chlorobaculum thiosulfatiphilum TaxID=115852 RepID=A0A5C4S0S6_CHLTI|nr:hypothetical protein [Chlorobaculum thiosulfatiphilum]TNJ37113.1 hypothetical protein FGF66_11195 [Chlorobaculum thiosulfatiphilum]
MKKQKQLDLLEAALVSTGHRVRYEKGSFIGGDCRVKENMIVVVNKFLPIEGKIATLASVLRKINPPGLSPEVVKIIDTLVPTDLFSRDNG